MNCRHCKIPLKYTFLDLGYAPHSNAYLRKEDLNNPEVYFPLKIKVCDKCWLVQTEDCSDAVALFTPDYAYFSSASKFWLSHAKKYSTKIIKNLNLNKDSFVVELASNDGYLLKNFLKKKIPCLGIEPTKSTANAAEKLDIPVIKKFFSNDLAKQLILEGRKADLIIGNNVYAHVPDINDFTKGIKTLLKKGGTVTLEFPHLMNLIDKSQFDTIYHEHFSYLSLHTVIKIFKSVGLKVWDVEKIPTHGGSLRLYGCHLADNRNIKRSVSLLLKDEIDRNLQKIKTYLYFQNKVDNIKNKFLSFLIKQKNKGKNIVAYGAAAKGNTLLNYAGIKSDLISIVFDGSISKQGKYMPGSHIPILDPINLKKINPDCILILPWNIEKEIKKAVRSYSSKKMNIVSLNNFKK